VESLRLETDFLSAQVSVVDFLDRLLVAAVSLVDFLARLLVVVPSVVDLLDRLLLALVPVVAFLVALEALAFVLAAVATFF